MRTKYKSIVMKYHDWIMIYVESDCIVILGVLCHIVEPYERLNQKACRSVENLGILSCLYNKGYMCALDRYITLHNLS